jgi:Ser/Thr protein kinase RdoA (MazF antagonist)
MTGPLPPPLAAHYSTADAVSVANFVAETWPLPEPIETALLNRGFNDMFDVRAADRQRYVLRLSGWRARGPADVAAETAFLVYLDALSVPVAAPVLARDGRYFSHAMLPEGRRPAVLFHYVDGRPPRYDDVADAQVQGVTLARIHETAIGFGGKTAGRYRLDLDHLLHRQVAAVSELAALGSDTRERLTAVASRLAAGVMSRADLTWTYCHGDCHGFNALIRVEGPRAGQAVFFDFDDGGFGYLAYDLAVHLWAQTSFGRRTYAMWHAFVAGYRSVREIAPSDFDAVQLFVPIRHIWLIGEYASRTAEWGTAGMSSAWLEREVKFLEAWEAQRLTGGLF